jgi:hypothetical protein
MLEQGVSSETAGLDCLINALPEMILAQGTLPNRPTYPQAFQDARETGLPPTLTWVCRERTGLQNLIIHAAAMTVE